MSCGDTGLIFLLSVLLKVVPRAGIEPARLAPADFKSAASTSSATWARRDCTPKKKGGQAALLPRRPRLEAPEAAHAQQVDVGLLAEAAAAHLAEALPFGAHGDDAAQVGLHA